MSGEAAGAAAPASGGQAGQSTGQSSGGGSAQPAAERGRIGDFSNWSGRTETTPSHQQIALQDPSVVGRNEGDPIDPFEGYDAQSQALVVDDSQPAEVMSQEDAQREQDERAQRYKQYDEWHSTDDLPEPFMQRFVVATIDGQKYRIPVQEAIQGYQRNSDYSNKLRQVYAFEAKLKQQFAGLQAMLADLDSGSTFLDAMVALGKTKGFHEAAVIHGKRIDAESKMDPNQRAVVGENRALKAQNQDMARRLALLEQRFQQEQQQQPLARDTQFYYHQLAQLLPRATERAAKWWVDSPASRREFELHLDNMLPSLQGGDLTTDFIVSVMQAAMESVQLHLQADPQATARQLPAATHQQAQQRPPGRSLPGPAPSSFGGNGRPQRARIGDLGSMVGRRQ